LSSLGSVTENEEFRDQGKDPMITVTRRIMFAATTAMNSNDPVLGLLSVDYDSNDEPNKRQPPHIVQGPAKSGSTTELDNIREVNRKNIRTAPIVIEEEGVSPKSLNDRPKKRASREEPRWKPKITIDTVQDQEVCCGCKKETTKEIGFSPSNGGSTQYLCTKCYESMQTGSPVASKQELHIRRTVKVESLGDNQYSPLTASGEAGGDEEESDEEYEANDDDCETGEETVEFGHPDEVKLQALRGGGTGDSLFDNTTKWDDSWEYDNKGESEKSKSNQEGGESDGQESRRRNKEEERTDISEKRDGNGNRAEDTSARTGEMEEEAEESNLLDAVKVMEERDLEKLKKPTRAQWKYKKYKKKMGLGSSTRERIRLGRSRKKGSNSHRTSTGAYCIDKEQQSKEATMPKRSVSSGGREETASDSSKGK
jgi:hypothetical protein